MVIPSCVRDMRIHRLGDFQFVVEIIFFLCVRNCSAPLIKTDIFMIIYSCNSLLRAKARFNIIIPLSKKVG
jgi:hypothetical protein